MDRVLLVYEDSTESSHIEITLRKVGFDVETIPGELSLSEKLLSFNPDVIVAHGKGIKLQTLSIGKKLKESFRYMGKVVLIFPAGAVPQQQELRKARLDVLVEAPVGTLNLAETLLKLTGRYQENILDKLVRIAQTDIGFRSQENKLLAGTGKNLDQEISYVGVETKRNQKDVQFITDPGFANEDSQETKVQEAESADLVASLQQTTQKEKKESEFLAGKADFTLQASPETEPMAQRPLDSQKTNEAIASEKVVENKLSLKEEVIVREESAKDLFPLAQKTTESQAQKATKPQVQETTKTSVQEMTEPSAQETTEPPAQETTEPPAQDLVVKEFSPPEIEGPEDFSEADRQKILDEVQQAKESLAMRVAAYSKVINDIEESAMIEGLPIPKPSGPLRKQEARRKQKELLKSLDPEVLKKQDADRRQFVMALHSKKKT